MEFQRRLFVHRIGWLERQCGCQRFEDHRRAEQYDSLHTDLYRSGSHFRRLNNSDCRAASHRRYQCLPEPRGERKCLDPHMDVYWRDRLHCPGLGLRHMDRNAGAKRHALDRRADGIDHLQADLHRPWRIGQRLHDGQYRASAGSHAVCKPPRHIQR